MWAHDVDSPDYAARLDALEAALPGRTIHEALAGRPARRRPTRPMPPPTPPASTRPASRHDGDPRPRHRDLLRRDGGGGRRRRQGGALLGRQQPGRAPRPLRRRRPRDRQSRPRRAAHPGRRPSAGRGRHQRRPRRRGRRHRRPGPGRRAARRGQRGQGPGPGVGRAVRGRQPPRGPHVRGHARGARHRAADHRAAGFGRSHAPRADGGPRPLPAARLDDRRRRGRGLRQGGPLPRPRLPGRSGHRPHRHRGRPDRHRVPPAPSSTTATTSPSAA